MHVLYRFYSRTGQLLYVGITMNPPGRFKNHRDSKDWWGDVSGISIEHYSSREDLANAERRAIQVEHPLHNIVHTKTKKPKPAPPMPPPAPAPPVTEDVIANLFKPARPVDPFKPLFNGSFKDTRYGCVTEEQYERRKAAEQAKQQARRDCPLCDPAGYRNGYLCDHVDHSAEKRVRLQLVHGGDE